MARPREHDEGTRQALQDAAASLLREGGDAAVTVRAVADRVGTSTRAIYSTFGSKNGLVAALFRRGFAGLEAEFATVPTTDDPVADLHALGLAYRRSARDRPDLYDVMFDCPIPGFVPDDQDQLLALGTLDRLRTSVARALDAGALGGDLEQRTLQLWGLVHGLASLELAGWPPGTDADAVWDGALAAILAGMR